MTPEQPAAPTDINLSTLNSERQSSSWDIRNAPRNYAALVAYQVLSAAFSFGAVWLITRHLGSEGYGGIVAIIAASQVAQVFVNWTSTAVVRFGVDEFVETEKISRTFWVRFVVLVVNLLAVALISRLWFPTLADWLKLSPETFWLVIAHFAVTVIWIHVQMSLQAAKLPRVQGLLQMIERLLIFVGIFALTAAANLTPIFAMLCYIIAPAAMIFAGLFKLRHFINARFDIDRAFVRKIVAYSIPLLPFSLVGYFSGSYVDAVFVSQFLSTNDLGIYSVATQINGIALQLPTLANTLLLPLFVTLTNEGLNEKIKSYFTHALPAITLVGGLSGTILSAAGYVLIPVIFGSEFEQAALPLWILISSSVVGLPALLGYASATHSSSLTYVATIASVFAATANIALNFLLIPIWGLEGCAWATLSAILISTIIFATMLKRKIQLPPSWSFFAILPNLTAAITLSLTHNIYFAITIGITLTALLLLFKRRSFTSGLSVIMRSYK